MAVGRHARTRTGGRTWASLALAGLVGFLLFPIGARAASSVVTIVGPGATSQSAGAKVTNGRLQVTDGGGSLTIDGAVNARISPPLGATRSLTVVQDGDPMTDVFPGQPKTIGWAMGSITVTTFGPDPVAIRVLIVPACATGNGNHGVLEVNAEPNETTHLDFPQPMVFANQAANGWCVSLLSDGGTADVTMIGSFFHVSDLTGGAS